jgi:hypothetical protein
LRANLVFNGESEAELVSVLIELGSVNGGANRSLNTRAESLSVAEANNTSVGDLGLSEGSSIQLKLGTDFKGNRVGTLGIPGSLTGSLDIRADTVVVRGSKVGEVVSGVDSNRVDGSGVTEGSVVPGDLKL